MMQQYYQPAPKASWKKVSLRNGDWHVLYDGDVALYRFTESNLATVKEQFAVGAGWESSLPTSAEKDGSGYRFWSSGRWIVVHW